MLKFIKHVILGRKEGKLESLRSVELWFTFVHLPALIHTQGELGVGVRRFSMFWIGLLNT